MTPFELLTGPHGPELADEAVRRAETIGLPMDCYIDTEANPHWAYLWLYPATLARSPRTGARVAVALLAATQPALGHR